MTKLNTFNLNHLKHEDALLIVVPIPELTIFAEHANQLIESKQFVVKARKTRIANTKEEEE